MIRRFLNLQIMYSLMCWLWKQKLPLSSPLFDRRAYISFPREFVFFKRYLCCRKVSSLHLLHTGMYQIQNIFNQSSQASIKYMFQQCLCVRCYKRFHAFFFICPWTHRKIIRTLLNIFHCKKNGESFSIFQFNREKDKLSCSWKEYSSTSIKRD